MTDHQLPEIPAPDAPREPLLSVGTITALAAGAIALAVSFGLDLSAEQTGAITAVVSGLAPLVVALWGRAKVFSPATVRDMVKAAEAEPRL